MPQQTTRAEQLEKLRKRAAQVRARAAIRRWEYKQRRHAMGVWDRLREVLARAAAAYVVPNDVAISLLLTSGLTPESAGSELHPPKKLVFVTAQQAALVPERREIPVRLSEDLLEAQTILLVPFGDGGG